MLDLAKAPPGCVEAGGRLYRINSGFRTGILLCRLLEDDEVDESLKPFFALRLYYPEIPDDMDSALERIGWFYRCGEEISGGEGPGGVERRCYSFDCDADYIYAAFMQQYGIDLHTARLHWWSFQALFSTLSDDCLFTKIVGWRRAEITRDMTDEQRSFLYSMKHAFALPENRADSELERVLMHGGCCGGIRIDPPDGHAKADKNQRR